MRKTDKNANFCSSKKISNAYQGIQQLKIKTKNAKENIDLYLQQLNQTCKVNPNKVEEFKIEKRRILQTKQDIESDLNMLDNIEDTFLSVCDNLKPQGKSKRKSK